MNVRLAGWIPIFAGLIAAVLWAVAISLPHVQGRQSLPDGLEAVLLDLRFVFHGPKAPLDSVVIVAVDDATLSQDRTEAGRNRLARIVNRIRESGARSVAIDILLTASEDQEGDRQLAAALAQIPSVIAAAGAFDEVAYAGDIPRMSSALLPQREFLEVSQTGFVNLAVDHGGTPRHVPMIFVHDGEIRPSLALVAASQYTGEAPALMDETLKLGAMEIPLDAGFHLPLRYIGPSGTIRTVSARDLLDAPRPEALSDRLVVLGFTASATGDRFTTPFDASFSGVEIIATAVAQLLGGQGMVRNAQVRLWDAGLAVGMAALCTALVLAFPLSIGMPVSLTFLLFGIGAIWSLFAAGVWMSAALPITAAMPPAALASVWRYTRERRIARTTETVVTALKKFHSPALAQRLVEDPDFLSQPISCHVAILFIDLTGFTRTAQILGPEETQRFLKDFHGLIARSIEENGGSVMNFMGDGAFAVFGAEDDSSGDAADAALRAAFTLVEAMGQDRPKPFARVGEGCRIGLHAGIVILSRLGAVSHQQFAATGDNVNLASRLMEVAKAEKAVIAASSDFIAALNEDGPPPGFSRTVIPIRGRVGDVEVYLRM